MGKYLRYLFAVLLFAGCSANPDEKNQGAAGKEEFDGSAFTIDDARMFFAEYGPLLRLDGMGGGGTRSMALEDLPRLLWDSARYSTILGMEVIEVPFEGLRCNISAEQAQPQTRAAGEPSVPQEPDTGDNGAFNSIVRLLSGLDDNGEIWYASAYTTASDEYLQRTGGWETFDMGDIPDDFCGTIMFSRIDGTFIGGNIFEEGALTGNVLPADGAWDDWWDDDCDTTTEVWEVCYTTSISGAGLPTVSFTECKETNRLTKRNCPDVGLIVPSKPGLDISKPDVARDLVGINNLTVDQWAELAKSLNLIRSTCMGRALYDELVRAGKMGFKYHSAKDAPDGIYDEKQNIIQLKNLSDDGSLFHEMFHRYQHLKYGSGYSRESMNIEVEARVAECMYKRRKYTDRGINPHTVMNTNGANGYVDRLGKMLDYQGNLLPGKDIGEFNKYINQVAAELKTYDSYENMNFDQTIAPMDNLKIAQQLMQAGGC